MTRFYWLDTKEEAETDAALKAFQDGRWIFCADKAALKAIDITEYDGIYLRTGMRELEQEFSAIMCRNAPKW